MLLLNNKGHFTKPIDKILGRGLRDRIDKQICTISQHFKKCFNQKDNLNLIHDVPCPCVDIVCFELAFRVFVLFRNLSFSINYEMNFTTWKELSTWLFDIKDLFYLRKITCYCMLVQTYCDRFYLANHNSNSPHTTAIAILLRTSAHSFIRTNCHGNVNNGRSSAQSFDFLY